MVQLSKFGENERMAYSIYDVVKPKPYPLADTKLSHKFLDLVQQAKNCIQLKQGAEATKTLNSGIAGVIIMVEEEEPLKISCMWHCFAMVNDPMFSFKARLL